MTFRPLDQVLVVDTETNGLWHPDKLHVVCTRTLDDEVREFRQPLQNYRVRKDLLEYLAGFSTFAGHNFIQYDLFQVLDRLLPGHPCTVDNSIDTLVVSRLLKFTRQGGHSLESWGKTFGVEKIGTDIDQWEVLTDLMVERCHSDTAINMRIIKHYMQYLKQDRWQSALETEHQIAGVCAQMTQDGFAFDKQKAEQLYTKVKAALDPLDEAIATQFPPKPIPRREVTPRITKDGVFNMNDFRWYEGEDLSIFNGGPFTIIDWQEFNPGSTMQVVERLNKAGWRPKEKTKGHLDILRQRAPAQKNKQAYLDYKERLEKFKKYGWKVSEDNLATLPASAPDAAHQLAQWTILGSRVQNLTEWMNLMRTEDGHHVIHGSFNPIGAWTHRLSHSNPNMANIPVAKRSPRDNQFQTLVNDINDDMRALWVARVGHRLVGTDADGIQMRIFAHYTRDRDLIDAIVHGSKDDGSDIHTLHQGKLGSVCRSRDTAKTFIYAWLLGAGNGKVAEILDTNATAAKAAVNNFIDSYPGLAELKREKIPNDAAKGYFEGLDGRLVVQDSEHLMLAGYLQNGEAVIMKRACLEWQAALKAEGIPFRLVTWPHDEWQTEIPDDDDVCSFVQEAQIQSIRNQEEQLGFALPLDGSSSWGYSWKDTH